MALLSSVTQGEVLALAAQRATGVKPQVDYTADHVRIYWKASDLPSMRAKFADYMAAKPGPVRVEVAPIVNPYIIRQVVPYLAAALALGVIVGRIL